MKKITAIFVFLASIIILLNLVSGCTNKRITPTQALLVPTITPVYTPLLSFGTGGTCGGVNGPTQFMTPCGIAVDSGNNVYLADLGNNRIIKFDGSGNSISSWGGSACSDYGAASGQFHSPFGVAIDNSDNIYVLDTGNNRVQKFDSGFNLLKTWGGSSGNFSNADGIAVSGGGTVFVADTDNDRIQKFDTDGNFLLQWGSEGAGNIQFVSPTSVAVDNAGNFVYVADTNNKRVLKFDSGGNYIRQWGGFIGNTGVAYMTTPLNSAPWGIAVDSHGNVFVGDPPAETVIKFDPDGNSLTGFEVADPPYYGWPWAIAIDHNDNVYAVCYNSHVKKFGH